MRVEVLPLRIGHCRAPAAASRKGAGIWPITFPAGAALIRHPIAGDILFDCGYGESFWRATQSFPERIYRWTTPAHLPQKAGLPTQLARLGADPKLVLLSHLHADHVAGLFDLGNCPPVLTSRLGFRAMGQGGRLATLRRGLPQMLRQKLLALPEVRFLEDLAITPLGQGFEPFAPARDLLGDGSLMCIPLPGHGEGQFGLFIPQATDGPVFLIADAAWSRTALRDDAPPPRAVLRRLGDAAAYLQTFAALRRLMALRPEIAIWPSHCPETYPEGSAP